MTGPAGLALLLLVGLAVYHQALDRDFVYDEIMVIRDSAFITDPVNLLHLFGETYKNEAGEQTYRPVVTATYILDCLVWGNDPYGSAFGYTLTNLLIHILAAWFLGLVVRQLAPGRPWWAGGAALLYLVHPALVETVVSPGNREQILSVLLCLVSAWTWRRGQTESRIISRALSPLFLFLALYTLEWSVFIPALLAAWAWTDGEALRRALRGTLWHWLILVLFLILRATVHPEWETGEVEWLGGGPLGGLWAFGALFPRYLRISLLPVALRPSYLYGQPPAWLNAAGLLMLAGLAIAVLAGLIRRRRWALGLGLFGLALAPMSHILMPFWIVMAERYLALPLVGGVPLLAAALGSVRRRVGPLLLFLIAASWALLAHQAALHWQNNLTLWERAVQIEPNDPTNWTNYGAALDQFGRLDEVVEAHRRARELALDMGREYGGHVYNLARALGRTGRASEGCDLLLERAAYVAMDRNLLLETARLCRERDPAAAVRAGRALVKANPRDCNAWMLMCQIERAKMADCLAEALAPAHCPTDGRLWLIVANMNRYAEENRRQKIMTAVRMVRQSPQADELQNELQWLLQSLRKQ